MTYRWHDINIQWTFSHLVDFFAQISQVLCHVLWWSHDHYTSYNHFTNVWWFLFHPCYMCHHHFHLCHCLLIVIALSCCILSPEYRYLRWQVSTKMYQSCLCLTWFYHVEMREMNVDRNTEHRSKHQATDQKWSHVLWTPIFTSYQYIGQLYIIGLLSPCSQNLYIVRQ
jgi:hypothetical protein